MKYLNLSIRYCLLCLLIIGLFLTQAQALPLPGASSGNGIQPYVEAGNPTLNGFKFPDGVNWVEITSDGNLFDWTSSIVIATVIVKGGPFANIYQYDPTAMRDTGLHAPINPNNKHGKYYGLSHIEFVSVPVPPSVLLMMAGLIGIVGIRRKLKQ